MVRHILGNTNGLMVMNNSRGHVGVEQWLDFLSGMGCSRGTQCLAP
jgi:hypothetical protein